MKFVEEFRNADLVKAAFSELHRTISQPWTIMEICGGQTHALFRYGFDKLLPPEIEMVHGPGCPVCVTPLELIDKALAIAALPNVIFTSFGDMLRVPGSNQDLFSVRATGGQIRVVYSPLDAVQIAQENPDKEIVFFAIGFETTVPANAAAVLKAEALNVPNFSVLVSQVTVPQAMETILNSPRNRVQGFLAAGHVCTVMGYWQYHEISKQHGIPIVVTGFEPLDLIQGILLTVQQLEKGTHTVQNAYTRVVSEEGNKPAQEMINKVFEHCDQKWRGIGVIPDSGLCLRGEYSEFNAETRFDIGHIQTQEPDICIAGEILIGQKKPPQCEAFGTLCTPQAPLGATMVSSEGACAAYFRFTQRDPA